MVAVEGENMRGVTWVRKRQIGGQRLTTKTDKSSGRQSGRLISAGSEAAKERNRAARAPAAGRLSL
jgi:hypothetical protein